MTMSERTKRGPKAVTESHKKAMASGRNESRAVRLYLEALAAHKPKRGRKRTTDSVRRRLETIEEQLPEVDPLTAVNLIQEQMNLEAELLSMEAGDNLPDLEEGFVQAAAAYSERKGITYAAWRAVGVEAAVLKRAGISR
jgi:hypothetical protein